MRIGFDYTPLLLTQSGVTNYTKQLLHHLIQLDNDWEYLLYGNRPLPAVEAGRAQMVERYFSHSRWVWMQFILPQVIRRHRPDLCHFPNNSASLLCSAPYVITIHDASLFLYSEYHPRSRILALRLLLPLAARRATAVITVSHHARREISRVLRLAPDDIHVIHEAAPDDFAPLTQPARREQLRRQYHLPEQFILYVGTIEPRKNLVRLVQAVGRLHRWGCPAPLLLAGGKGWLMEGVLEQEIERQGLQGAVRYLGYVPQADLPGLYALATVFAFPSLHEGFGLPPLEAMACGTAVVTSEASAMAEVCGAAALLVDPYDTEAIAEALRSLLSDRERREALAQAGYRRARHFSWRKTAEQTADLYRKVQQSR